MGCRRVSVILRKESGNGSSELSVVIRLSVRAELGGSIKNVRVNCGKYSNFLDINENINVFVNFAVP